MYMNNFVLRSFAKLSLSSILTLQHVSHSVDLPLSNKLNDKLSLHRNGHSKMKAVNNEDTSDLLDFTNHKSRHFTVSLHVYKA